MLYEPAQEQQTMTLPEKRNIVCCVSAKIALNLREDLRLKPGITSEECTQLLVQLILLQRTSCQADGMKGVDIVLVN